MEVIPAIMDEASLPCMDCIGNSKLYQYVYDKARTKILEEENIKLYTIDIFDLWNAVMARV